MQARTMDSPSLNNNDANEDDTDMIENENREWMMKKESKFNRGMKWQMMSLVILWACIYGLSVQKQRSSDDFGWMETRDWIHAQDSLWSATRSWWILCICSTLSWFVWERYLPPTDELYLILGMMDKPSGNYDRMIYKRFLNHSMIGVLRWSLCRFFYQFFLLALLQPYFSTKEMSTVENDKTTTTVMVVLSWIPPLMSFGFMIPSLLPFKNIYIRMAQAPFMNTSVTFMDGFIADICTSMIWPLVNLMTSFTYIISHILSLQQYEHEILHTYVLPICRITPLWWRFAQCLRSCYDTQQRWPHLGNAFKYMMTAHISLYGLHHTHRRHQGDYQHDYFWYTTWILTTLYQLVWDVQLDWNLFSVKKNKLHFREHRLYSTPTVYWSIFVLNIILRFGWTWSFLPFELLPSSTSILSMLEIFRRMIWGWLRVEWEIKSSQQSDDDNNDEEEQQFKPMKTMIEYSSYQNDKDDLSIVMELGLWATAFTTLSIFAAMHE